MSKMKLKLIVKDAESQCKDVSREVMVLDKILPAAFRIISNFLYRQLKKTAEII